MNRVLRVLLAVVVACGGAQPTMGADMPADLADVVAATLEVVAGEAPAHADCLEGLVIRHAWEHDDTASYYPDTATIVLRVPATAARLEFTLVHEIAHHLEFACPAQVALRPVFLEAQGFDPGTDWFEGDVWEEIPSEQFATAFAQVITGGADSLRHVPLTNESLALVVAWATGGLTHEP